MLMLKQIIYEILSSSWIRKKHSYYRLFLVGLFYEHPSTMSWKWHDGKRQIYETFLFCVTMLCFELKRNSLDTVAVMMTFKRSARVPLFRIALLNTSAFWNKKGQANTI